MIYKDQIDQIYDLWGQRAFIRKSLLSLAKLF